MAHHDPAIRAALIQARDQVYQHEVRKHRDVEPPPEPEGDHIRVFKLTVPGSVTATTYLPYYPMFGGSLVAIWANVSAPTTSTLTYDILFNGVSIYVDTLKPTIPTGLAVATALPPDDDTFPAGTKIQVQVTAAGGGVDLVVSLMFSMRS